MFFTYLTVYIQLPVRQLSIHNYSYRKVTQYTQLLIFCAFTCKLIPKCFMRMYSEVQSWFLQLYILLLMMQSVKCSVRQCRVLYSSLPLYLFSGTSYNFSRPVRP